MTVVRRLKVAEEPSETTKYSIIDLLISNLPEAPNAVRYAVLASEGVLCEGEAHFHGNTPDAVRKAVEAHIDMERVRLLRELKFKIHEC